MAAQLVALPAVERLSPACIRILGGNPGKFTLQGTNTYLVGTGKRRILIDTGEGRRAWKSSLQSTLQLENVTVDTVLISHWHPDHTGGIRDIVNLSPSVRVYKNDPEPGQSPILHGQTFRVEGATLTAAHTPGHTADHMIFVMAEEDSMFTADNVLGHGTAVFEDMSMYLKSLETMRGLFGGRAYPGHGPVVDNGPARIAEYIEHRRQREEQVIKAMRAEKHSPESCTAMDIVKVVYCDVPENLHEAACRGVLQILDKMKSEGRVTREGNDSWRLKERPTL